MDDMGREDVSARIASFVRGSFEGRQIETEDDIFALGFGNSMFAMQLVNFVEKTFDIEIDGDDLEMQNFRSIQAITGLVERKLSAGATA
jgi:methoxymalonate biosynthesis acyl carrier protein